MNAATEKWWTENDPIVEEPEETHEGYTFPLEAGRIDLTRRPEPRDNVISNILPARKVHVTAGMGGTLKTTLLINQAISVVLARPYMPLGDAEGFEVKVPGAVLLALGDEDGDEVVRRVGAAVKKMNLDAAERKLVEDRLVVFPCIGQDMRLTATERGTLQPTGLADVLIERAQELGRRAGVPVRLIGLDHLMLVSGGEVNSNEDSAVILKEAGWIAVTTGAAVNIVAHSPKSAAMKTEPDQQDIIGAVATVNLARGATVMRRLTAAEAKDYGIEKADRFRYARVSVVKANSTPMGVEFIVRSDYDAEYEAVTLERVALEKVKQVSAKAHELLELLEKLEGEDRRPVAASWWQKQAEKDGLGARATFFRHLKELRDHKLVEVDEKDMYRTAALTKPEGTA
jgi:RecA-family ATPase